MFVVKRMREAELICSKVKRKNGDLTAEWKLGKTGETFMGCYDGNINICFSSKIATSELYVCKFSTESKIYFSTLI